MYVCGGMCRSARVGECVFLEDFAELPVDMMMFGNVWSSGVPVHVLQSRSLWHWTDQKTNCIQQKRHTHANR
jgi:hypothetical protein